MPPSKGFSQVYLIFLFLPLNFATATDIQNYTITIPLNKNITWADKELYGNFINVKAASTLEVTLAEPDESISFIIFQVHSHLYNVTLYNNTLNHESVVVGKNIGLYSLVKPKLDTFYIYNQNDVDLKLYVTVEGYDKNDPIPGGCNMEFPTPISPYIQVNVQPYFIIVDLGAPRDSKDTSCQFPDDVTVVFYQMYLPERNHKNVDVYFNGIQSMSTLEKIMKHGEILLSISGEIQYEPKGIPSLVQPVFLRLGVGGSPGANGLSSKLVESVNLPENTEHMRRRISTYYSMGTVYVAVAYSNTNKSAYSVYVPNAVYTCDPLKEGDCRRLHDALSYIMCVLLFGVGAFLCFFGHYCFKTEMFLVGTLSGVIVTYIVISLIAVVEPTALLCVSLLSGVGFGAIWLLFWWFYGIPLLSVFLPALNLGFLVAAMFYYALPGGLPIVQVDLNFWTLFISITLMTALMLISMTFWTNILSSVMLGSYAIMFGTAYFLGFNYNYIIINTVRRAVVPNFNKVILAPPFSYGEWLEMFLWMIFVIAGTVIQYNGNRGRPPFPPPPRSVRPSMPGRSYGAINREERRQVNNITGARNRSTVNNETAPLLA